MRILNDYYSNKDIIPINYYFCPLAIQWLVLQLLKETTMKRQILTLYLCIYAIPMIVMTVLLGCNNVSSNSTLLLPFPLVHPNLKKFFFDAFRLHNSVFTCKIVAN